MVGDPAPWFRQASTSNPRYNFDTAAGRYIVLCFFGSAGEERGRRALGFAASQRGRFDDEQISFFGVSNDSRDLTETRVREALPGVRFFWDFDATVARLYGSAPVEAGEGRQTLRLLWFLLDPNLRVIAAIPFQADGSDERQMLNVLNTLPPIPRYAGLELQAPVLFLPNVFEPELCRELIDMYEADGGKESGFMREVDGKTVSVHDYGHKRRRDFDIADQAIIARTRERVKRRIAPEIQKVHQFEVTRMERYIVACYEAETGGHFRPHRDNTTKGTAHRRFAVSINLNGAFDGGEIGFPEFSPRTYKAPPGGAVVFSCSLLHWVKPVTKGRRFAFLPFLYDETAARQREENNAFLGEGVAAYRAATVPEAAQG
ncbi:MAG: 2OG-Fe(II) oxygenase [Alphaproteobacteria bacterium]|nr:2OG-Fe(II) oxygenase [Alphaproteobacteria bacterium]